MVWIVFAAKKRSLSFAGNTPRFTSTSEANDLRREAHQLKEALAEQMLENRLLKKNIIAGGGGILNEVPCLRKVRDY